MAAPPASAAVYQSAPALTPGADSTIFRTPPAADLEERTDLAAKHPDLIARIEKTMREARVPSKQFKFKALDQQYRHLAGH